MCALNVLFIHNHFFLVFLFAAQRGGGLLCFLDWLPTIWSTMAA